MSEYICSFVPLLVGTSITIQLYYVFFDDALLRYNIHGTTLIMVDHIHECTAT